MKPTGQRSTNLVVWLNPICLLAFMLVALPLISGTLQSAAQARGSGLSPAVQSGAANTLLPIQARRPAPDLTIKDISENTIALSQYRGKVVLLDFWAVDCGGCVVEIPWYVEFDKNYHDKGLQVLGIDMYEESPSYIKAFMQKSQMEYPVAVGNDELRNRFQAGELPKTVLIDRQGRVAVSHVGIVNRDAFAHDIEELLREK